MPHVSRPLIALLAATVVLAVLWVIALKPSGHGAGSSSNQGLGQYQSDINAAHQAVQTANGAGARAGADPTTSPATPTQPTSSTAHPDRVTPAATTRAPAAAVKPKAVARPAAAPHTAVARFAAVQHALRAHKVLALLFYNPAGADDRAVRQELGTVPTHGGRVFKLAVPLSEIQSYVPITNQVAVNVSPTLVLIAPGGQVGEIVGYTDPFEISQRVDQALALGR